MLAPQTPLGPPIRTPDGVIPAPLAGGDEPEPSPPTGDENSLGWRTLAALIGLVTSAAPLFVYSAVGLERLASSNPDPTALSYGLMLAFAVSAGVSIPCFYIAGSDRWRRPVRWWRAIVAWPTGMLVFPVTSTLILVFGTEVLPDRVERWVQRSGYEPVVFFASLFVVPGIVSFIAVLALMGVISREATSPTRPRAPTAPDRVR